MREEFENLPEIAEKLKRATWVEKYDQHLAKDIYCKEKDLHFLDGAWYTFQEQQKKIDAIMDVLNNNHPHLDGNQQALVLMDDMAEVLK